MRARVDSGVGAGPGNVFGRRDGRLERARRGVLALGAALALLTLAGGELEAAEEEEKDLIEALEASFQRDLVEAWYPRSLDREAGGYFSDFSFDWEPVGRQRKFIVTQARHLWMTSQLSLHTGEERFLEMARHGYLFLRDKMRDRKRGGFYLLVSREGKPLPGQGKTAYGMSFAIYGLAAYYEASGDAEALELAREAFAWLEANSWDAEFGGYVDRLELDGSWRGETESKTLLDPPAHIGLKDYNSSIHLLECLTALYHVDPAPLVKERLGDMLRLVRDRFATERGFLQLYFFRDWTPVSFQGLERAFILENNYYDHVSWGHDVETAFLMLEAEHALGGEPDGRTLLVAKQLVDHALATGWDAEVGGWPDGGFYFREGGPCEVIRPEKVWWTAAEGMNALLMMAQLFPQEERYRAAFEAQWNYVQRFLIDPKRGGWYPVGLDTNPEAATLPKASIWKASYHDGRSYLNCLRMLRDAFPLTSGGRR